MPIGPDTDRFGAVRADRSGAREMIDDDFGTPEDLEWLHEGEEHRDETDDFEAFLQSPIPKLSSDGGK